MAIGVLNCYYRRISSGPKLIVPLHNGSYRPENHPFANKTRSPYCTVSPVDPVMPPEFAVMFVLPAALQLPRPAKLGAFAIVATLEDDELQWLFRVMSCVLLSLKVPVAVNC